MKRIFLSALIFCIGFAISNANEFDTIPEIVQIEKKYNLNLITDSFVGDDYANRWASWSSLTDEDSIVFDEFIQVFAEEWNKYPQAWIKVNKLENIAFVKDLNVSGQNRFAMPDPYDETLYYDIEYLIYGADYVREMIHHEFWHMIEEQQFGDMYYHNITWCSFNRSGFKYGAGGSAAYTDDEYVDGEHTKPGFVTNYSMYGEEEDRAEIYCWLFTKRTWELLDFWVTEDHILQNKLNWMLSFIESKVPEMNRTFFDKINSRD